MAYIYKPIYYSSFQDTITSLCKSILPFSFKNRLLQADQKQARRISDNLKWQQDYFHRILHLIGLRDEGIVSNVEVSAFRSHPLCTIVASTAEPELPAIIRDKLLFLQELLFAKCISSEEYLSSKRPLLQKLAAQGVEIDSRDVAIGAPALLMNSEEEWSEIDLNDHKPPKAIEKVKEKTQLKLPWIGKVKKEGNSESSKHENNKRKPFQALFQREKQDDESDGKNIDSDFKERGSNSYKKNWGFEGIKKWKRRNCENDSGERSNDALLSINIDEKPDMKRIKNKIQSDGSSSDLFIDKVLGENIKKELSRIKSELSATNQKLNFSDDQIEAISMKLPVDKTDLNKFFPKTWCNTYGDSVLDVVKKEFKDHVGEMENLRNNSKEIYDNNSFDGNWVTFENEDENFHPNIFSRLTSNQQEVKDSASYVCNNNPFIEVQNPFIEVQNPFLPPKWDN